MTHLGKSRSAKRGCGRTFAMGFLAFWATALVTTGTNAAITEFLFSTEEPLVENPSGGTSTAGDRVRLRHAEIGKYLPSPAAADGTETACTSSFFDGSNPNPAEDLLGTIVAALTAGTEPPAPAYAFGGHLDAVHSLEETFTPDLSGATPAEVAAALAEAEKTRNECGAAPAKQFLVSTDEVSQIIDVPLGVAKKNVDDADAAVANARATGATAAEIAALESAAAAQQETFDELEASLLSHPGHVYLFESTSQSATRFLDRRDLFWDQPQADIDAIYQGAGAAGSDAVVFSVDESVALYDRDIYPVDTDENICGSGLPAAAASFGAPTAGSFAQMSELNAFAALLPGGFSANVLLRPIAGNFPAVQAAVMKFALASDAVPDPIPCTLFACTGPTNEETPVLVDLGNVGQWSIAAFTADPAKGSWDPTTNFYTPNVGETGVDTFVLSRSSALLGELARRTVTITINATPVAEDAAVSVVQGIPQQITLPATDADDPSGATLVYTIVSGPTRGSLGTVSGNTVTYTAPPDPGSAPYGDSFIFRVTDGGGAHSDATIDITAQPNQPPVAVDDSASTNARDPVTVAAVPSVSGVLSNDSDPEGESLVVSAVNGAAGGVGALVTLPSGALVTLNSDGSFTYDPANQFPSGGTDSFAYTVSDGNGGTDTATVTITVDPPTNTAPTVVNDTETTPENTPITIDAPGVLANDVDLDSDPLTVTAVNAVSGNVGIPTGTTLGGSVTLNANGSYTYDPTGIAVITVPTDDTFTYTVADGFGGIDGGTVTVTITPAPNIDPVAVNDVSETDANTKLLVADGSAQDVLENDTDANVGDILVVSAVNGAAGGVGALVTLPSGALVTLNANGSYTYDPNGVFDPAVGGTDTFDYTVSDGRGGTAVGTVVVTITSALIPNQPPVASPQDVVVAKDVAQTITLVAADVDDLPIVLTYQIVDGPSNGTLSAVSGNQVTYTPNADYLGSDSFTFTATDDSGAVSNLATVTITVIGTCATDTYTQQPIHTLTTDYAPNKVPADADGTAVYNQKKDPSRTGNLTVDPPLPAGLQYPLTGAGAPGNGPAPVDFADPNDIIQYSKALGTSRLLFDLDTDLKVEVWNGSTWIPRLDGPDVPDADHVNITGVHINEFFIDASATPPKPVACQVSLPAGSDDATRTVDMDACPILFSVDRPVRLSLTDGSQTQIFTEKDVIMYQPFVESVADITGGAVESLTRYDDPDYANVNNPPPPIAGDLRAAFDGDVGREQIFGLSLEAFADPGVADISTVLPEVRTVYFTTTSEDQLATTDASGTTLDLFSRDYEPGSGPFSHDHGSASTGETPHAHHINFDAVHRLDNRPDGKIVFSTQDPIILGDGVSATKDSVDEKNELADLFVYDPTNPNGPFLEYNPFGLAGSDITFPSGDVDGFSIDPGPEQGVYFSLSLPDSVNSPSAENPKGGVLWDGVTNGQGQPIYRGDIVFWSPNSRKADIVFDASRNFVDAGDAGEDIDALHWLGPDLFLISVGGDGAEIKFDKGRQTRFISPDELVWVQLDKGAIVDAILIKEVLGVGEIATFAPQLHMPNTWQPPQTADTWSFPETEYDPALETTPGNAYSDSPVRINSNNEPYRLNIDAIWVTPNPDIPNIDHFEVNVPDPDGVTCEYLEAIVRAAGSPSDTGVHPDFNYQGTVLITATDGADSTNPVRASITLPPGTGGVLTDEGLVDPADPNSCDAGTANDGKVCYQFPAGGASTVPLRVTPLTEPVVDPLNPDLVPKLEINLDIAEVPGGVEEGYEVVTDGVPARIEDDSMFFQGIRLKFCEGPAPGQAGLRSLNGTDPNTSNAEWCNDRVSVQISDKSSDELPSHGHLYLRLVSGNDDPLEGNLCASSLYAGTTTSIRMAYECVDPSDDPSAAPTSCDANPASPPVVIEGIAADGTTTAQAYSINQLKDGYSELTLEEGPFTDVGAHYRFRLVYPEAGVLRLHAQLERLVPVPDPTATPDTVLPGAAPELDTTAIPADELEKIQYISGSSQDFLVRPFAYRFSAVTDAAGKPNPKGYSTGGNGFVSSGSAFKFSLDAVAWQATDDADDDGHPDVTAWPAGYNPGTGLPLDADGNGDEHRDVLPDFSDNAVTLNYTALAVPSQSLAAETVALKIDGYPDPAGLDPDPEPADADANYTPTGDGRTLGSLQVTSPASNKADASGFNFTNGTSGQISATYSEVGSILLKARTTDYFGSDWTAAPTYERQHQIGPNDEIRGYSDVIGRFYPHDFIVDGYFNESGACTDGFVYMGEPNAINVGLTVTAKSLLGNTTLNYDNTDTSYAFTGTLSPVAENNDDGTDLSSRLDIDLSGVNWIDGVANYTGSHTFSRQPPNSAPDGPYPAVQFGVQLNPSSDPMDIVGGVDMNSSQPSDCTNCFDAKKVGLPLDVRYGRMDIADVSSNSTDDIAVIFRAEYFDKATNQFVLNTDDQCSVFAMGPGADPDNPGGESQQFGLEATNTATGDTDTNQPGPNDFEVDAGTTFDTHIYDPAGDPNVPVTSATLNINNGYGELFLRAPGEGSKGYVDVSLRELVLRDSWLSFDWDGDGSITDSPGDYPVGRVTFGRYEGLSGDGRVRYWKEIFR